MRDVLIWLWIAIGWLVERLANVVLNATVETDDIDSLDSLIRRYRKRGTLTGTHKAEFLEAAHERACGFERLWSESLEVRVRDVVSMMRSQWPSERRRGLELLHELVTMYDLDTVAAAVSAWTVPSDVTECEYRELIECKLQSLAMLEELPEDL